MNQTACRLAILSLCAAGLLPVPAAQAQWIANGANRPPPLYPYELQPGQSYAVEVAPGAYVIHHPAGEHRYRRVNRRDAHRTARLAAKKASERAAKWSARHVDQYAGRKPDKTVHIRRIVREKPPVIRTRRVVNDPPKVITRRHYVDDVPAPPRGRRHFASGAPRPPGDEYPRVIHADAEITILGPDRMSIRLVRKDGRRLDGGARAGKAK